MKPLAEPAGSGRRPALLAAAIAFAMLAVLGLAARAHATETIYWNNYNAKSVGFADVTGSGGGELNVTGTHILAAEGMAYDPVSGRIYLASSGENEIDWANVDGSGGGVLEVSGMTVERPRGLVIDLATRTIYWANGKTEGSIGWSRLDGSAAGLLNTTGATTEEPVRPSIDTANNRLYWFNNGNASFGSADLGGSGGADLALSGATEPENVTGLDIDPVAGRLYWLDESLQELLWVNVSGVGGGAVDYTGANYHEPFGLAFDPTIGRFYWGNYLNAKERTNAIGTTTLAPGGSGGISPATAPVDGVSDPIVLKSPVAIAAPQVTRSGTTLSCSQGVWGQDYPGSFVYSEPTGYSYQWVLKGAAVATAAGSTLAATAAGSYSCSVTAKNPTGSTAQTATTSATVTAATLSVALKSKKVQTKAGKTATVKLGIANAGDLASTPAQVCATLTKKAKKGLIAPRCALVQALGSGGSAVATLKVKTKKTAKGTYKFTALVKGTTAKPVTVSVKVIGAKKHKKHHRK